MLGKKKFWIIGAIAVAGLAFVGTKYFSYAKNAAVSFLDKHVSPEQEIERLRGEVAELTRDIDRVKDDLAGEIATCEKLTSKTTDLRAKVVKEEEEVMAFKAKIDNATNNALAIGKLTFSIADAKQKLKDNVAVVAKRKQSLQVMEAGLATHEQSKVVLQQQLEELVTLKQQLNVELDAVATDYKLLQLQQTQNKYHRDDTRLSKIRESIDKLKDKAHEQKIRNALDTPATSGSTKPTVGTNESTDDIVGALNPTKPTKGD